MKKISFKWPNKLWLAIIVSVIFLPILFHFLLQNQKIFYANFTEFIAFGVYVVQLKTPTVGDLVAVELSEFEQKFAESRGYIGPGWPLLKRVAAIKDDEICLKNYQLFINGEHKASVRKIDSQGKTLRKIDVCKAIEQDEFFLLGDALKQSYDSRYFGLIKKDRIKNVLLPLIVWQPKGQKGGLKHEANLQAR